ncbi:MAG: MBL fold metallo-hydrolase [Lachnospiraceae bacterium]|nr:MBL fold metallo-hydrolase [Lachnospiraceae bacterium]
MAVRADYMALGPMGANCIMTVNTDTMETVIFDPGGDLDRLEEYLSRQGYRPAAIVLTHGHFDHIMAVEGLKEKYGIPVYAMEPEAELLRDPMLNLSYDLGFGQSIIPDVLLRDGEDLTICGIDFKVMLTPGHTSGSGCFYCPEGEFLISGDTLFKGSVGRTDFPTGNTRDIINSCKNILFKLPEETVVYPGHEGLTTIGFEKMFNFINDYDF